MKTKTDGGSLAMVAILLLFAFVLIVTGIYLKSGPELAMIIAGVLIAWFTVTACKGLADGD